MEIYGTIYMPAEPGKFLSGEQWHRFWSRVKIGKPDECWPWDKPGHNFGYGSARANGKNDVCHRISYKDCVGPIPKGLVVRHACDNPICCNPNHLDLGTQKDNMDDALIRGRLDRGARYRKQWLQRMAEHQAKKEAEALSPFPSTKEIQKIEA